jgi:hypothetical protein
MGMTKFDGTGEKHERGFGRGRYPRDAAGSGR